MANKRTLKRAINLVSEELFTEAVAASLYGNEKHETNAAGVAHFELKTLEDLGPAGYDDEGAYFTFRAFDKQDEPASEEQRIWVEPGDKKALVLKLNPSDQGGGDE